MIDDGDEKLFNKKLMILTIFIVSLLAVSAVSAAENGKEYVNAVEIGDEQAVEAPIDDVYLGTTEDGDDFESELNGTFTDLANQIAEAKGELNLTRNYTYCDDDFNYIDGIIIDKSIIINGNGFSINGNNQARAFKICAGNVALNNICFVDCYSINKGGAVYLSSCYAALTDVIFINNSAKFGGAVCLADCDASLTDVIFINNSAIYGGAIYSNGTAYINNSIFSNMASKYAPAIFSQQASLIINNTQFINLKADMSAGAVAVKVFENLIIENCDFKNTSSTKNGGAIFIDSSAENGITGNAFIRNVSFSNSYGDFGGAVMQLKGNLDMDDLTFINCSSKYDGGAVYLSNVNASINNSKFISNRVTLDGNYQTFGGAIYFDYGNLNLAHSKFVNNSAFKGSGVIAIYDSTYKIISSSFDDNGEAIYVVFKGENSEIINFTGSDTVSEDNVFYPCVISGVGQNLTLIDNGTTGSLPSSFDLRVYNLISPVKNQGIRNSCWADAGIGILESSLLKSAGLNASLSVNNLQNIMIRYSKYGINYMDEGGFAMLNVAYLLSWLGSVPQEYDAYDELGKISPLFNTSENIHIQDIIIVPRDVEIVNGDPSIKQAIIKYGAILGTIFSAPLEGSATDLYNEETYSQYVPNKTKVDHEIIIVGWNDSFSRENFLIAPPGDGAWIIQSSWGTSFGDNGYYYVSYYDKTLIANPGDLSQCAVAIVINNTTPYNRNYQYDFLGLNTFYNISATYVNRFVSIDDDLIAAVGTYFNQSGARYNIDIEVNGEIVLTQEGISPYFGYHTIKLDEYVPIKKGDNFSVYITSDGVPISAFGRTHCKDGVSLIKFEDGSYFDLYDQWKAVACIKVYTVDEIEPVKQNTTIEASYDIKNSVLTVNLTDGENAIPNENVVVDIDGNIYDVRTSADGQAKISTADLAPGTYTANISFKGNSKYNATNTSIDIVVKVNTTLSALYNGDTHEVVATLSNNATGQAIRGANVRFTINNQVYTVKTDLSGEAKLHVITLTSGTNTATVSYNGNSKYNPNNVTVDIIYKIPTSISAFYNYESKELVAGLINNDSGQAIKGANVKFAINNQVYSVRTDSNGQAKLNISTLDYGIYAATVSYNGNIKYGTSNVTVDVVNKISTSVSFYYDAENNELVATLINTESGKGISGANVVFNVNGVKTAVKTNKQGQARLTPEGVDLDSFNAGISYGGNSKYLKSTGSIKIIEGKIPTVISNTYDGQAQEVTATLTNNQTGQFIKGATVVFNVNGVKTSFKTDNLGQVKISVVDLVSGINSIGSSYGGNSKYAGSTTGINIVKS